MISYHILTYDVLMERDSRNEKIQGCEGIDKHAGSNIDQYEKTKINKFCQPWYVE